MIWLLAMVVKNSSETLWSTARNVSCPASKSRKQQAVVDPKPKDAVADYGRSTYLQPALMIVRRILRERRRLYGRF